MLVSDIMTLHPFSVQHDQPLRAALEMMEMHHFHHLPVLNEQAQLIGIITGRDCRAVLRSATLHRADWETRSRITALPVRVVMTPAPVVAAPDMEADEAVRLMLTHHLSGLPVVRSETLVGIITTSDILTAFRTLYRTIQPAAG